MKTEHFTPKVSISMTPSAIMHITSEKAKNPKAIGIRLYLETSGCSGYMYETEWVEAEGDKAPTNEDEIFQQDGVQLYVSRKDLPILNGTLIDYVTQGLNATFQFKNPNATAECGCGESFSVESI
jgi:iron-sulfur cluster assembly protein